MTITLNGTTGITTPAITNNGTLTQTGAATLSSTLQSASTIGVGGATPAASGAGITFPATQSASSNANTLDDYEEGTFTPNLVPNINGSFTYNAQAGMYTKIGNMVHVSIYIQANKNTANGSLYITGLPFTTNASQQQRGIAVDWYVPSGTGAVNSVALLLSNDTQLQLAKITASNVDASAAYWNTSDISSLAYFWLTFSYITA